MQVACSGPVAEGKRSQAGGEVGGSGGGVGEAALKERCRSGSGSDGDWGGATWPVPSSAAAPASLL